jgi:hypothetical protein
MMVLFALSLGASAQNPSSAAAPATACPVEFRDIHVDLLRVRVRNTSGKKIVGMVFNVALSDATERWKWLHWLYDPSRPLQEFGWTKPIKEGEEKKLSWDRVDLEHEHGGGVLLALTSVLFADGSTWEEGIDSVTCKAIWYNDHKKGFTKPVQLPRRE